MYLGGDWEVQARYMRGTCVVQARKGPGDLEAARFRSPALPRGFRHDCGRRVAQIVRVLEGGARCTHHAASG